MKTSLPLFMGLVVLVGSIFFSGGIALAQEDGYYSKGIDNVGGYWKLKTDINLHGTQIRFYSADSQLVYQESLPNQFIELNARNIRRLDQALARLLDNRLVASTLSTSPIPFEDHQQPVKTETRKSAKSSMILQGQPTEPDFQVQLFTPTSVPAVHLVIANPTRERLRITILSADNTPVYEHITHLGESRHHLNFDNMPAGSYQIYVQSTTQQYQLPVTLSYGQYNAVVQINGKALWQTPEQTLSRK